MSIPETILKTEADDAFIAILDDWQEEAAAAIDSAKMELVAHTPPDIQIRQLERRNTRYKV